MKGSEEGTLDARKGRSWAVPGPSGWDLLPPCRIIRPMEEIRWLCPMLNEDLRLQTIGDRIWSAVSGGDSRPGKADVCERMVANRFYGRFVWGTSPERHQAFAREAAVGQGPVLDAGCGTMGSTADVHRRSNRVVVGLDLSAEMLRRARDRVGAAPLVGLLQADLFRLPFQDGCFETVLCMGTLHMVEDAEGALAELRRVLHPNGRLYLSTLVKADRRLGDRCLAALHRSGAASRPRSDWELRTLLSRTSRLRSYRREGNVAYACLSNA